MSDYPPTAATQIEDVYDQCAKDLAEETESVADSIALQQVHATLAVAQAILEHAETAARPCWNCGMAPRGDA